jgi:hypothetical protein
MVGQTNLDVLLSSMDTVLIEGVYVFVTLVDQPIPTGITPRMVFQEAEGTTLLLLQEQAETAGLDYEFPSRMITLNIHSSLEAVGFMARITTELAKANMGVNPISAFYHDHLFVPDGREGEALDILNDFANKN